MAAERRLKNKRKRQQGEHAAEIARAVEEIRVVRMWMAGARKPALDQRCGRRNGKERCADRDSEQTQQPDCRRRPGVGSPARGDTDWQHKSRHSQDTDMHNDLVALTEPAHEPMRISIPGQQHGLKKHQGGVPDRRRASEQGQDHFCEQRLHQEQQRRTNKYRCREQPEPRPVARGRCIRGGQALAPPHRYSASFRNAASSCSSFRTLRSSSGSLGRAAEVRRQERTFTAG